MDGVVPLSALLIFATYAGIHRKLPASMAFTVLALLSVLVRVFNFAPAGVQYIAEALVAVQRLHRLLKASNDCSYTRTAIKNQTFAGSEASVIVVDGWFAWALPEASIKERLEHLNNPFTEAISDEMTDQARKVPVETIRKLTPVLKGVNLTVQKGNLIGITGAVGSGKSSFLLSLLGEMECIKGSFITERPVAYVPQQPWIFNDTLRNNILFGGEHDTVKYERVLAACALDKDVLQFPAAHDTEIGERGLNLSGGQKARISLARACYSNAPLVLLDDPFSAVDIPTLNHLVQNTLHGVLRGRTIILSTHNNRVLEHCDEVYKVVNGEIHAIALVDVQLLCRRGHLVREDEVQNSHGLTTASAPPFSNNEEQLVADCSKASKVQLNNSKSGQHGFNNVNGVLTVKEDRVEGLVTKATYEAYMKAGGTYHFIFLMGIFIFTQLARMMISYWLAVWADEKYQLEMQVYIGSFACIVFGATLFSLIRAFAFSHATSISAKALHTNMATSIFNSPLLFFEKNPVGRILNRFGKDQACIDELLPMSAQNMLENLVGCLGAIALITVLIPWFLLAIPPFVALLLYFQRQYTAVSRELKRLEGTSRSPIYEHFSQTLEGITSIRAYSAEDRFHNHFASLIDENHRAFILFLHVTRWLGFRLDFSATWCVTITSLLVVLFREHLGPGIAGVVLVQSLQLTGLFQYGVRMAADTENNFTSVERMHSYSNLPQESVVHMPLAPISNDWPSQGEIVFLNYTMAYRENLVPVLKNISLKIDSQEKVAILGRTGVGKSSLALGMFRMVENSGCSGSILIDGVDVKCVDPDELRRRLSIIPQDPVLFKDTIRMNLDPFEQHTDSEIHEAIRGSQLTTKLENLERGLDTIIGENGISFSVGESQLLCLARAILRKSKILVMDEATSAVDIDTDKVIQDVLQREFNFCTLIGIAHRISTVMNCDRFLLLHNGGKMSELENPKSISTMQAEDFERVIEKLLEDSDGSPCSTTELQEHISNLK